MNKFERSFGSNSESAQREQELEKDIETRVEHDLGTVEPIRKAMENGDVFMVPEIGELENHRADVPVSGAISAETVGLAQQVEGQAWNNASSNPGFAIRLINVAQRLLRHKN